MCYIWGGGKVQKNSNIRNDYMSQEEQGLLLLCCNFLFLVLLLFQQKKVSQLDSYSLILQNNFKDETQILYSACVCNM
jgi:hypothetical protein